jgi:integrase
MRRWKERGLITRYFVEYNGEAVASVKTAFKRAVKLAGLPGKVSPHTLRHTAATWLMQAGADRWQAAGYLGMSVWKCWIGSTGTTIPTIFRTPSVR